MALRFVVLAALVAAAFGDSYHHYGYGKRTQAPVTTTPPPKCTANGERCKGAPGYPYVPYAPCCGASEGYECVETTDKYDWGSRCVKPKAPKCYKPGQRCIGEKGYPYVPYAPCCGYATCSKVKGTWGKVCVEYKKYPSATAAPKTTAAPTKKYYKYGYRYPTAAPQTTAAPTRKYKYGYGYGYGYGHPRSTAAPATTMATKTYHKYGYTKATAAPATTRGSKTYGYYGKAPSCYATGERAVGAPGKPYVPWAPCCSRTAKQVENKKMGWGKFCLEHKKCAMEKVNCGRGAAYKCCEGYKCVKKPYGYGSYCMKA